MNRQLKLLPSVYLLLLLASINTFAQKPELVVQTGHYSAVSSVVFSPDGKILASSSGDTTVKLWDVFTGKELRTLRGHTLFTSSLAFSPDGRILASGSSDQTVKVWHVATGKELHTLSGHSFYVTSVAFSPNGRILASATSATVRLWDTSTWKEVSTLVHTDPVNNIAFSPDGTLLASGCGSSQLTDYTIKLWEVNTGKGLYTLRGHSDQINAVAFSPDGRILASGSSDKTVKLWEVNTGEELRTFKAKFDWVSRLGVMNDHLGVSSVAFNQDGRFLATGNYDGKIKLWELATGKELRTLAGIAGVVTAVAFSPLGILASSSLNNTIKLWNAFTGDELSTLKGTSGFINSVSFSPEGRMLASANAEVASIPNYDGALKVWDLSTGGGLRTLKGHNGVVESVTFSRNGKLLASGGNKSIRLWEVPSWTELRTLGGDIYTPHQDIEFRPDGQLLIGKRFQGDIRVWDTLTSKESIVFKGVHDATFSPDGKVVATSGDIADNVIRLWSSSTWEELRTLKGHTFSIKDIAFSEDGKLLASGSWDSTAKLWNVASGQVTHTLTGHSKEVSTVAFSPDGKVLAGGSQYGGQILLWDVSTGKVLYTLKGHSRVVFSPDGKLLATQGGIDDFTLKLWDVSTGKELHTLAGHSDQVDVVAFAPDGKILVSGGRDTRLKLWDVDTGKELASLIALDENDWAVVTPDGLFDGSPAAWNKIIWRAPQNTYDFAPVEAYFNDFYYPGLLPDLIHGKRPLPPAGKDLSRTDRRRPTVKIALAKPPAKLGDPLSARTVTVRVEVANNTDKPRDASMPVRSGAQDVRLFRNDSLVKVWRGDVLKQQETVTLEASVAIVAGANEFTAYGFNHDNIKSEDATLVVTGAVGLKRKGAAYILAVGVNEYANAQYNLKYAVPDARDFGEELKRQQQRLPNYERVEVIRLFDKEATKENILQALTDLQGRTQPQDAAVVYFAGHGTAYQNQFYLIPHDLGYTGGRDALNAAGLKAILSHSISDRELEQAFEKVDAGHLLLVVDACNSGQALEAEEKRRGPMNSKGLAQLAYEKGMYILTAAQSYQEALGSGKLGHGYLTYALVEEGLKGVAADSEPKDGRILLREWLNYATDRVPQMQEERDTRERRLLVQGPRTGQPASKGKVQRPRVFYRREMEGQSLIVAQPQ